MKIGYFVFERLFRNLVDKPIISRIRGTLFTITLDMNFLDRYHKAVTQSGVNFGKDLMSFWYWTNLGLYLMYKSLYVSHKGVFKWTFYGWYGLSQVADYFGPMLGRRRSCWADVGPLAAISRLLGSLHDGSLWWYCILLSVNLCIVYSYFHVCFICSSTIILCVIKTVQPTPLVVSEPGRYNTYSSEVVQWSFLYPCWI